MARLVRPQTPARTGETIRWDPSTGTIDAGALEGIDAVVHLAGVGIGDERWTEARKRAIRSSRTEGTALIASTLAALQRPPTSFVSGSATGFYGDGGDRELTERSPVGSGFRADVVQAWEAAADPAIDAGIRTVLLRSANVLSRDGGLLPYLLTPFKLGLGARFGDGEQWFPWISLRDEVAVIRRAIDDERPPRTGERRGARARHEPHVHEDARPRARASRALVGAGAGAGADRGAGTSARGAALERQGGARCAARRRLPVLRPVLGARPSPHPRRRGVRRRRPPAPERGRRRSSLGPWWTPAASGPLRSSPCAPSRSRAR